MGLLDELGLALDVLLGGKKDSIKEHGGKIITKYADINDVIEHLKKFVPKADPKLKTGYTEKSIENQLVKFMKERFVEITPQYGIEGRNARFIDIDVANGVAGIELKDAKKVVKTAEMDRMFYQLTNYQEKRYKDDNLFLLLVGEREDHENSFLLDIIDFCKKNRIRYGFYELGKGYIEEVDD